jgi:hypothetical protein
MKSRTLIPFAFHLERSVMDRRHAETAPASQDEIPAAQCLGHTTRPRTD